MIVIFFSNFRFLCANCQERQLVFFNFKKLIQKLLFVNENISYAKIHILSKSFNN